MFHRTIAAALVGAALFAVPALAGDLKPYQKAALEKMLGQVEPKMRDMARPQLEQMLAPLSEAQVKMMMAAMAQNMAQQQEAAAEPEPEQDAGPNPADIAYNEAQVKPMIRKYYDAHRAYDLYVEKKNEDLKHSKDYGVFGSGWGDHLSRLEVKNDQQVGSNYQLFENIYLNYIPQDGRYRFDFSKVKTSFNAAAIDRIIAAALKEYDQIGTTYVTEGNKMVSGDNLERIHKYYQTMNGKVFALIDKMNKQIAAEAPADGNTFGGPIIAPERIN